MTMAAIKAFYKSYNICNVWLENDNRKKKDPIKEFC